MENIKMSLELLSKEVVSFVEESWNASKDYLDLSEELHDQVNEGLKGVKEADNLKQNHQDIAKESLNQKKSQLRDKLQRIKETDLSSIQSNYEPVTADLVAEVTLLSQLDLQSSDIEKYKEKYKNNPLLLKKLRSISEEKKAFVAFEDTKEETLEKLVKELENALEYFESPDFTSYGAKINIIANGTIDKINRNVKNYKNY